LSVPSVRGLDGGFGALVHGVEWLEADDLISLQRLFVFEAAQDGQVDGIVVLRA
jgi:hypothetical protein